MDKNIIAYTLFLFITAFATPATAQTGWRGVLSGVLKTGQALTITDSQLAEIVADEVRTMDAKNKVCPSTSTYAKRLERLTKDMTNADGIELNFKVYQTSDINAFACPDGSVRVFSALMDIMTDDELLGIIGHEIGHVALRHTKNAWRQALLRSAASDAIGAFSGTWAGLSHSYLGDICGAVLSAKHSRYHETQADDFGYDFLKQCGRNPWAMGKAFIKLKKLSRKGNNSRYAALLRAFSSHPDFDERIRRMKSRAEEDGFATD